MRVFLPALFACTTSHETPTGGPGASRSLLATLPSAAVDCAARAGNADDLCVRAMSNPSANHFAVATSVSQCGISTNACFISIHPGLTESLFYWSWVVALERAPVGPFHCELGSYKSVELTVEGGLLTTGKLDLAVVYVKVP
jgi:hypothetical protein